jgi:predicted metalloendopeptidase
LLNADSETQHKYTDFLICLHKNYVNYSKNKFGYEIDGTLSLSEQMADNFGILASYKAYVKESQQKNALDEHKLLPGLKYSQEQIFFIRYAQSYCRKKKITNIVQFEQFHVIHEYRAFQPSLIPEFNKVFNCNASYQNDMKSCKIFKIDI